MALDEDLSKMKDEILRILPDVDCDVTKDRLNFFVWELNFLDIFLCLRSFAFSDECGMLHVIQKMQEIWKRLNAIIYGPDPGAYFNEFLTTSRRDEFIHSNTHPFTFHVPTEIWKIKLEFRAKYSFPKISLPANKDVDFPTPKFVMEFIDDILKILGDLVKIDDPCSLLYVRGLKEQIEDVFTELKLLRLFVCFVSNKCIEPQSQQSFFTHALIEAVHTAMVTWLYLPIHGNENQDLSASEVNVLFSNLLKMKIKPIRPGIHKTYIDVLLALKSTIQPAGLHLNIQNKLAADCGIVENPTHNLVEHSPSGDDQMAILQEMLALLRDKIIHLATLDHGFHLQDMDTVIVDAGFLIYSLYDSKEEKDDTTLGDVNRALSLDLPSNIQPIKAMIYLIIQKTVSHFNLPTIHGLGYVDFLLNNLKEFQGRYANSLVRVNDHLQIIQKELESLQPFLKIVAEEQHSKFETLQDCVTQLISKAYQVEYVLDACINKDIPHWCLGRFLLDIIEEIKRIKAKIQEKDMVEGTIKTSPTVTSSQLARIPRMNEEIVGFEDVIENLRNQLLNGIKGQDVISVHGMPGQGKTTLAYRLYSDSSVVSQFDIRAQCCVSQVYSYKDLLLSLLRDAIGEDSQRREKGADELADILRKTLLPKRYLILVDDLWENSAWDDLRCCFPDTNNRSRIILTTRHLEVAEYASVHGVPLHLRMFTDDESWKLLEKEVFGQESCSPHLIDVGKRIAIMCAQLPLSVALVAGILKDMEKNEESWEKMAENLGSHIHGDSKGIIEQSYQNLPYHLRSCFLYFGAFLEDKVIKTSKLTRLWISEGFVISCGGKRLEDIAEGYLENLIQRNLVMVAQKSNLDSKVKECHLHDVLLDFCKERASEENLLLWIKWDQSANPFSSVYSHKQHAQRRLAFSEVDNLVDWNSSCSLVGSVLFKNEAADLYPHGLSTHALVISRILQNFRFLKVLDLEHYVVIDSFPSDLIYLRYVSAQIDQTSIPSSISKLRNLETLILKCRKREYTTLLLPITVWEMVKLRHLHISEFDIDEEELRENSAELYDLETFSAPYFSSVENAELMLRKTPNLRKLRCKVEGDFCYESHVLDFPTRLEILQIYKVRYSSENIPFCISAPNLKSLTISGFRLDPQNLLAIAQLQNLQVLKLYYVRFGYPMEWKVSNGEFPQLKVLKLQRHCPLEEWTVEDDAFPNLEQLFLDNCRSLKEIPSSFGDITSLKYIEVRECNESVAKSAREIRETQVEDYQNADFKLFIVEE